jgi:hypothetical protein
VLSRFQFRKIDTISNCEINAVLGDFECGPGEVNDEAQHLMFLGVTRYGLAAIKKYMEYRGVDRIYTIEMTDKAINSEIGKMRLERSGQCILKVQGVSQIVKDDYQLSTCDWIVDGDNSLSWETLFEVNGLRMVVIKREPLMEYMIRRRKQQHFRMFEKTYRVSNVSGYYFITWGGNENHRINKSDVEVVATYLAGQKRDPKAWQDAIQVTRNLFNREKRPPCAKTLLLTAGMGFKKYMKLEIQQLHSFIRTSWIGNKRLIDVFNHYQDFQSIFEIPFSWIFEKMKGKMKELIQKAKDGLKSRLTVEDKDALLKLINTDLLDADDDDADVLLAGFKDKTVVNVFETLKKDLHPSNEDMNGAIRIIAGYKGDEFGNKFIYNTILRTIFRRGTIGDCIIDQWKERVKFEAELFIKIHSYKKDSGTLLSWADLFNKNIKFSTENVRDLIVDSLLGMSSNHAYILANFRQMIKAFERYNIVGKIKMDYEANKKVFEFIKLKYQGKLDTKGKMRKVAEENSKHVKEFLMKKAQYTWDVALTQNKYMLRIFDFKTLKSAMLTKNLGTQRRILQMVMKDESFLEKLNWKEMNYLREQEEKLTKELSSYGMWNLHNTKRLYGLCKYSVIDIDGDGDCCYGALGRTFGLSSTELRERMCKDLQTIMDKKEELSDDDKKLFGRVSKDLLNPGKWGSNLTCRVFAQMYDYNVVIARVEDRDILYKVPKSKRKIVLLYQGASGYQHFDLLERFSRGKRNLEFNPCTNVTEMIQVDMNMPFNKSVCKDYWKDSVEGEKFVLSNDSIGSGLTLEIEDESEEIELQENDTDIKEEIDIIEEILKSEEATPVESVLTREDGKDEKKDIVSGIDEQKVPLVDPEHKNEVSKEERKNDKESVEETKEEKIEIEESPRKKKSLKGAKQWMSGIFKTKKKTEPQKKSKKGGPDDEAPSGTPGKKDF